MREPANKYPWTIDELNFLKRNFYAMTNKQLADHLGLKLTSVRSKCYELGLKRMELQYWTDEQIQFLKANYKSIGDTELAEIFSLKWEKPKGWTKKHIEKKRRYLKLKRTMAMRKAIHSRNVKNGMFKVCPLKAWDTRGRTPNGAIRIWKDDTGHPRAYIKTDDGFVPYARWLWEEENGSAGDKIVRLKDGIIVPESSKDLELLTMQQHAKRNRDKYNSYPEELKQTIKLTRKISKAL